MIFYGTGAQRCFISRIYQTRHSQDGPASSVQNGHECGKRNYTKKARDFSAITCKRNVQIDFLHEREAKHDLNHCKMC